MDDLISRQEALDAIDELVSTMSVCVCVEECRGMNWMKHRAIATIEALPTAERVGKWMETDTAPHRIYCSECYATFIPNKEWVAWKEGIIPRHYYPNCGADMRGEEE